jgi:gas vesicle protein
MRQGEQGSSKLGGGYYHSFGYREHSMKDNQAGDRITFFMLGTVIGAVAALLAAPASGARTRRTLRRKGEDAADYIVDAGKELAELCEDLYKRSGELVGEATLGLSEKYRELYHRSKELVDETAGIIRRASNTAKD